MFKDRTKSRAEAKNLNTARLPIDEYMERKSEPGNHSFSKVLTVNQGMSSFPNINYWENGWKLSMTTTTTTLFFVSVERGPFAWTRVSCDWLMVYKGNHEPIITNSCPPKRSQKSLQRKLEPILSLVFLKRVGVVWSKQDNKTLWWISRKRTEIQKT